MRFVAHDIRNLPKFTPGELDNSSIFDRVCKLERQMASMQHAPTFAAATRTQSLVTDEATDAAVTKRTEWQRQQRTLGVALPPPSTIRGGCEDGGDSDEGFSLPARQQRRVKRKERQTERRNEAQRPQPQRPQQPHVYQATRETSARPRTKVVRGTREQCPLRAGLVTREFLIVRVDKEHTADDIKEFIQEQEVTVIDISCVSHADYYTNSYDVVAQAKNVDNMSMPDSWPEGICCRRVYRKRNTTYKWQRRQRMASYAFAHTTTKGSKIVKHIYPY